MENKSNTSNILGLFAILIFLFQLYGYPITASIPILLQVPSTPINTGFRAVFLALSIMILFLACLKNDIVKLKTPFVFFLLFWIIYSVRLVYDLEIEGHRYMDNTKEWTYLFAFGGCFIPAMALFFTADFIKPNNIIAIIFYTILFSNVCLLIDLLYLAKGNFENLFISRMVFTIGKNAEGINKAQSTINPIIISSTGQILALLSIALLIIDKNKYAINRVLMYFSLILGLFNLVLGASRGPLVSFIILLIFIILLKYKTIKNPTSYNLKLTSWLIVISSLISMYIIPNWQKLELNIINRFLVSLGLKYDPHYKGEERVDEYRSAWNQFLKSPIYGDKFVDDALNSYPHNFLLEVLMATGILGAIPFAIMMYFLFKKLIFLYQNIQNNTWVIHYLLITLTIIITFLLSGGLFVGVVFWSCLAFIMSMKISNKETAL